MNLLTAMYTDDYFPEFLVDKIKIQLEKLINFLKEGENSLEVVQLKLDEIIIAINDREDEFNKNDSELETTARE